MNCQVGVGIPSSREGQTYPVGFASPQEIISVAVQAERLGFDSAWVNEHVTTQTFAKENYDLPPNLYEPMITLAYVGGATSRIRLVTGTLLLALRSPVITAKEAATLDVFTGGRIALGVGVGHYKEEFEAVRGEIPGTKRTKVFVETLEALRALLSQDKASYEGEFIRLSNLELFPKPIQPALPIYVAGNADAPIARAANFADGWISAPTGVRDFERGLTLFRQRAEAAGKNVDQMAVINQFWISIADSKEQALDHLHRSPEYRRLGSWPGFTFICGTGDEIIEELLPYLRLGTNQITIIPIADNLAHLHDVLERLASSVVPGLRAA